jgi:hypothetical protein
MEKKKCARSILDKREHIHGIITESCDAVDRGFSVGAVTRERGAENFATFQQLPRIMCAWTKLYYKNRQNGYRNHWAFIALLTELALVLSPETQVPRNLRPCTIYQA